MRKQKYTNVQYPYHLSERWPGVLPLVAEPGKVTLGEVTVTEAEWVERRYQYGKFVGVILPDVVREVVPVDALVKGYRDAASRKVLNATLGPSFPRRWNLANLLAFNLPMRARLGPTVYNGDIRGQLGRGTNANALRWYWNHLSKYEQVVADGYSRFLPLIRRLHNDWNEPDIRHLDTDPLGTLREVFGKGLWKRLCAQSPTRVILLSSYIRSRAADECHHPAEPAYLTALRTLMEALVEVPTTLLRAPWCRVRLMIVAESLADAGADTQHLRELAKARYWQYGTGGRMYQDALNTWEYVRERHPHADPRWSPRRVEEEHDRLVLAQRDEHRRSLLEERAALTRPVQVPVGARYSYTDYATRLTARLLTTPAEYIEQGDNQQHCVGGYGTSAQQGRLVAYSIERDGKIVSTAMFASSGELMQHYGKYNAPITDPEVIAFVRRLQF